MKRIVRIFVGCIIFFNFIALALSQVAIPEDIQWKDVHSRLEASVPVPGEGSVLIRTAATTAAWDADAVSNKYLFGDGYVEWRFTTAGKRVVVGLDSGDPDLHHSSFQYAIISTDVGTYEIRESGVVVASSPSWAVSASTVLRIAREGTTVRYYAYQQGSSIGSPLFTSAVRSQGGLLVDTSFYEKDAEIVGCRYFGPTGPEDVLWVANTNTVAAYETGSAGSELSKVYASTAFDSDAISSKAIVGSGFVQFRFSQTNKKCLLGLSASNSGSTPTSVNYGIVGREDAKYEVQEFGITKYTSTETYTANDVFRIERRDGVISYYKNDGGSSSAPFYTSLASSFAKLSVDSSFYTNGAKVKNVQYDGSPLAEPVFWIPAATGVTSYSPNGSSVSKALGQLSEWSSGGVSSKSIRSSGVFNFSFSQVDKGATAGFTNGTTMLFGIRGRSDGNLEVIENEVGVGLYGPYLASDQLSVRRLGGTVEYLKNGSVFRSVSNVPAANPLRVGASFYESGASIVGCIYFGVPEDVIWREVSGNSTASYYPGAGSTLARGAVAAEWNGGGIGSRLLLGDGYLEFSFSQTNKRGMVGFSESDPDKRWDSLKFAIDGDSGALNIYEEGALVANYGSYTPNDVLRITRVGATVSYYKNEELLRTSSIAFSGPLLVDSSLYSASVSIAGAQLYWRDRDSDSLDDEWEAAHFGNLNETGSENTDQDPFTNLGEFYGNLNPGAYDVPGAPDTPVMSGCRLWLRAEAGVVTDPNGVVSSWYDQSGNANHMTRVTPTTPSPELVEGAWNGRPVLRFDGLNRKLKFSRGTFADSAAGSWPMLPPPAQIETFVVLRAEEENPVGNRTLWVNPYPGQYPAAAVAGISTIRERFGTNNSTAYHEVGNPSQALGDPHIYNVLTRPGRWQTRINGKLQYTVDSETNTVQFSTAATLGGGSVASEYFKGEIAEIIVYDRELTAGERDEICSYLTTKYRLYDQPPIPTNFVAQPLSPTQALLTWNEAANPARQRYRLERRTGSLGTFVEIGVVSEISCFVDNGLVPNAEYQYRISAINYFGDSNAAIYPTFFTPIVGPEFEADGVLLWASADALVPPISGTGVNLWGDLSGFEKHLTRNVIGKQPIWVPTTFGNSRPGLYFDGTDDYLDFATYTLLTKAQYIAGEWNSLPREVFVVLKAAEANPSIDRPLWSLSGNPTNNRMAYPAPNGTVYEAFCTRSLLSYNTGLPQVPVVAPHYYNILAKPGLWQSRRNGHLQFSSQNAGDLYVPFSGRIGNNTGVSSNGSSTGYFFKGHIAEIIAYDRVLTTSQRAGVGAYLSRKYAIGEPPPSPTNFEALAIAPTQALLSWTQGPAGSSFTYILERKTGAGAFSVIATPQDVGSYLDSGVQAETTYTYRLKIRNDRGESVYSAPVTIVTPAASLSMPTGGMRLWLKADSLSQGNGDPVNLWLDQSGLGNDLSQAVLNSQPTLKSAAINGLPAVAFNGTSTSLLFSSGTFSGAASGEIFAVLRAANDVSASDRGLWSLSQSATTTPSYFPAADGTIRESFGNTISHNLSDPERALNLPNIYNVSSKPNLWVSQLNGSLLDAKSGTTAFMPTSPILGVYNNKYFEGDIAEIIVYNRMLTQLERDGVRNYLGVKYGELAMHGDLDADSDGLTLGEEIATGANPLSSDSNGDGIWDGTSQASGFNPNGDNPDLDGLTNAMELLLGTDPFRADTDGDGYIDGLYWADLHDIYPLDPTRWAPPVGDQTPPTITLTNPPLGTL